MSEDRDVDVATKLRGAVEDARLPALEEGADAMPLDSSQDSLNWSRERSLLEDVGVMDRMRRTVWQVVEECRPLAGDCQWLLERS